MKSKINQIAEKVVSVSAIAMIVVFAVMFTVIAICAGINAIIDFDLFSLIVCIASAIVAQFWYDFLKK